MADTATRIAVTLVDQVAHGMRSITGNVGGYPLGRRDHPAIHYKHPVIVTLGELFDDDTAAVGR